MVKSPPLTNALIMKLEQRDALSADEKRVLEEHARRVRRLDKGEMIAAQGQRLEESTLLLDGFCARVVSLENGARQITAIHVAGDFVDLHSFLLKTMDHSVVTLTECYVTTFSHDALRKITDEHPHLTRLLWLSTLIDGAIHRHWLAAMGGRKALGHLAHVLCEMVTRLKVVGLARLDRLPMPLRQTELADVLGLSTVHVNRLVKELRSRKIASWGRGTITIHDWHELVRVAEFVPTYLHLEREDI